MSCYKSSNGSRDAAETDLTLSRDRSPSSSVMPRISLLFTWVACLTEHFSSELFTAYIASSIFEHDGHHPAADNKAEWVALLNAMTPLSLWVSGMFAGWLLDHCRHYHYILLVHFLINGTSLLMIGCFDNLYGWMMLRLLSSCISSETLAPFWVDHVHTSEGSKNAGNVFASVLSTGSALLANLFLILFSVPYVWPFRVTGILILALSVGLGVWTGFPSTTITTHNGTLADTTSLHDNEDSATGSSYDPHDHCSICHDDHSDDETTPLLQDQTSISPFFAHTQWYLLCLFVILRGLLNSIVFLPLNTTFIEQVTTIFMHKCLEMSVRSSLDSYSYPLDFMT